jgi:hypothetical protein
MMTPEIALEAPPTSRPTPEPLPHFVVLHDDEFEGSHLTVPPPDGDAIYGQLIESTRPLRHSAITLVGVTDDGTPVDAPADAA